VSRSKWGLLSIALAAFALQRGTTLPLATAPLPGNERYEVTAVGLAHVVQLPDSALVMLDCRWWPRYGSAELCATGTGGERAFGRLRMVYPLLAVALWVAIGALFLQVLRVPRQAGVRIGVTWLTSVLAIAALVVFVSGASAALNVLGDVEVRYATLGTWLVVGAALLAALSGALHRSVGPVVAALLLVAAPPAGAQGGGDQGPVPGACWRLAFGAWQPPLDWGRSGHDGDSSVMAERMRRIRDSVFVRDTGAVNSNAMFWERTASGGWQLLLFPPWWPVGVLVTFDSLKADQTELTAEAVALMARAEQEPSKARVLARNTCPRES
jgi:hypothetical protein